MDSIKHSAFGGLLNKSTAELVSHFHSLHRQITPMNGVKFIDAAAYEACKRSNEYDSRKMRDLSDEINARFQFPEASLRIIKNQELTRRVREQYARAG